LPVRPPLIGDDSVAVFVPHPPLIQRSGLAHVESESSKEPLASSEVANEATTVAVESDDQLEGDTEAPLAGTARTFTTYAPGARPVIDRDVVVRPVTTVAAAPCGA